MNTLSFITALQNSAINPVPDQINPIHSIPFYIFKTVLNTRIIPHLHSVPNGHVFLLKTVYVFLISPVKDACAAHLIFLYLMTNNIGKLYA
jgi:hypothetical protein